MKPLGKPAYGSIPHLPGSNLGAGDHLITPGQAVIATEKARRGDVVIITEKIDGSCVSVAKLKGQLWPLVKAGYTAASSPYQQHHRFAFWVSQNWFRFENLLKDGERVVGEWMLQAHGIRYELRHEPFVAFDIMKDNKRVPYDTFVKRAKEYDFVTPALIHQGGPLATWRAMWRVDPSRHGAIEGAEGVMYRVENKGQYDFMAKCVRQDFVPGCLMPTKENGNLVTYNRNFSLWV